MAEVSGNKRNQTERNGNGEGTKSSGRNQPARSHVENKAAAAQDADAFRPNVGTLAVKFTPKSALVERFLSRGSVKTSNAFMRIGTLLKMLGGDAENKKKIYEWLDELFNAVSHNISAEEVKLAKLRKGHDMDQVEIMTPDQSSELAFYVNHPQLRRFANKLYTIDKLAYLTDQLWYLGEIDDEQKEMSSKVLMYPITATGEHFMLVTNVSRRAGGKYSPEDFLKLLAEEKDIRALVMKHFTDDVPGAQTVKRFLGLNSEQI